MKPTKIILGPFDAAYIFRANGSAELQVPKMKDDDVLPEDGVAMKALVCATLTASKDPKAEQARKLILEVIHEEREVHH